MFSTPLLVNTTWLAQHLDSPNVRIIDVRWYLTEPGRGYAEYQAGHIPGAVYLDIDTDLSGPRGQGPGRHPLPSAEAFAAMAARTGIDATTHVVAYDSVGGGYAARVWWLLRYFSHAHVSLLDGGWQVWQAAGLPEEQATPTIRPTSFTAKPQPAMVVDAARMEQLRQQPGTLLIDARAPERYQGLTEPVDARAGHIPGARSAPFTANLSQAGQMLTPSQLRERFDALGADQATQLVSYCGSGVTAAHNVFALELAGYPAAVLYEGSWSDWSADPQRPIATGEES